VVGRTAYSLGSLARTRLTLSSTLMDPRGLCLDLSSLAYITMTTESTTFAHHFTVNPDAPVARDFVGRTFHLSYKKFDLFSFIDQTGGVLSFGCPARGGAPGSGGDQYESPTSVRSFLRFEIRASPAVVISPPSGVSFRVGEWVSPWASCGACGDYEIKLEPDVCYVGLVNVSLLRPLRFECLGGGVVVNTDAAVGLDDGSNRSFFLHELLSEFGTGPVGGSGVVASSVSLPR